MKNFTKSLAILFLGWLVVGLSGCAAREKFRKAQEKIKEDVELLREGEIDLLIRERMLDKKYADLLGEHEQVVVVEGDASPPLHAKEVPLGEEPEWLDWCIELYSPRPRTLREIGTRLEIAVSEAAPATCNPTDNPTASKSARIQIRFSPDVHMFSTPTNKKTDTPAVIAERKLPEITYDHSGTVRDFLDHVATRYGLSWSAQAKEDVVQAQAKGGVVQFRRVVLRTYRLPILSLATPLSIDSKSENSTGMPPNPWKSIVKLVESLISTEGVVSTSESEGLLIVSDVTSAIDRVDEFFKTQMVHWQQQLAVEVTIISVGTLSSGGYEFNASWLRSFMDGELHLALEAPGISDLAVGGPASSAAALVLRSGKTKTKEALLAALKRDFNSKIKSEALIIIRNGRRVPINVIRKRSYLKSTSLLLGPLGKDIIQSIKPGEFTTGIEMVLEGRVLKNSQVLLRINLSLSELIEIQTFSESEGIMLQMPHVDTRTLLQEVLLKDRQTLLLLTLSRIRDESDETGYAIFGQNRGKAENRQEHILVLLRPRIL